MAGKHTLKRTSTTMLHTTVPRMTGFPKLLIKYEYDAWQMRIS